MGLIREIAGLLNAINGLRRGPWKYRAESSTRVPVKSQGIDTALPVDLAATEEELKRREHEWRQAGAVKVAEGEVIQALRKAQGLQREFNQAKARSRRGFTLRFLGLTRLFVLTRLPSYGKRIAIGSSAAIIFAVSLLMSPFVFSSFASAITGASIMGLLAPGAILLLWPTERKRLAFQRLQRERKEAKEQMEAMRPLVAQARADHKRLRQARGFCNLVDKARQRRDDLAASLASAKYQLMHTDWRSLRGDGFEDFLVHVFQMLGYKVQKTGPPQHGVDLLVIGKGKKIAVEAKGWEANIPNDAVSGVAGGMKFWGCDCCVVITNSDFTRPARDLAPAVGCRLIPGLEIPDLIEGKIY